MKIGFSAQLYEINCNINVIRVGWGYSGQGLFGTRRGYLGHSVLLIK